MNATEMTHRRPHPLHPPVDPELRERRTERQYLLHLRQQLRWPPRAIDAAATAYRLRRTM